MYRLFKGQMKYSDRLAIEVGIEQGLTFKKIGNLLGRHPSTVSHEVKANRTYVYGNYPLGNDCRYARTCNARHICGDEYCKHRCSVCREKDCHEICKKYISIKCTRWEFAPYVCNTCAKKKICYKERYFYSAKHAQALVERCRSDCRSGIRLRGENSMNLINSLKN